MPNATGKRRLLKLAGLLEEDAKNRHGIKFDMSDWGSGKDRTKPISCGTTACALGLAALSGEFKRAGLSCRLEGNGASYFWIAINYEGSAGSFKGPINSSKALFDLTEEEVCFLFVPDVEKSLEGAKGERFVAKRIRDFVAGKVGPNCL